MSYNPSASGTIGVELDASTEGVTPLDSPAKSAAFDIVSTVTETITTLYVAHDWDGPSSGSRFGKLAVDIYDASTAAPGAAESETRYAPTGDAAANNMFGTPSGWTSISAGSVYTKIDETTTDDTDYVHFTETSYSRHKFGTGAFGSTSLVSSVKFEVRIFGYAGTSPTCKVQLYNNTTFVSTLGTITPASDSADGVSERHFTNKTIGPFPTNPLTGAAWTAADIVSFSTGTGLLVQLTTGTSGNFAVSTLTMIVTTAGTDTRVATGTTATQTTLPSGVQTGLALTLAANWSKLSGHTYYAVLRRIDDPTGTATTLTPRPKWIQAATNPHSQGTERTIELSSTGLLSSVGAAGTKIYGFWLGTNLGAQSADSQPYWDTALAAVHTSSTVNQGVNGATVQAYKGVTLLVGYSASAVPTASLSVKLWNSGHTVQQGGTATVTTADVAAGTVVGTIVDATWGTITIRKVQTNLASSATLAAATNYLLEATSTTASTAPFFVVKLDATATHALTGNQTYGGSTLQASIAGSGVAAADIVARISSTITAPSSVTATTSSTTINGTTVSYAAVSWVSGGALGGSFSRWEVQRSEDAGTTWVAIATVALEATVSMSDYAGTKAVAATYRVRAVRTDGAVSDWTVSGGSATPALNTGVVLFTSNAAPTLTVGYPVLGDDLTYKFRDADNVEILELHNVDYAVSFRELEQRGIEWSFDVLVHPGRTTPSGGDGIKVFDALRALARSSSVPSVCMHTPDGERKFGTLRVFEGRRVYSAKVYTATVTFTEGSATDAVASL